MDWTSLVREFVTLFVVIDPVGTIPVFLFAVQAVPAKLHRRFAMRAVAIAALVLLLFLVGGQFLLETLGLRLGSFQIAGGIVLFLFALTMIFGESKSDADKRTIESDAALEGESGPSPAIFPLAVPSLASPGAMLAIVLLTDNNQFGVGDQVLTAVVMVCVLAVAFVFMLLAEPIIRLIGNSGAAIISRVMGMILASVAADAVLSAVLEIAKTGAL